MSRGADVGENPAVGRAALASPGDHPRTLRAQAQAIADGRRTSSELVERALTDIAARDGVIRAFAHLDDDAARSAADRADADLRAGVRLPLLGVPVAVKEDFATASPGPHHPVTRLQEAGAVILGLTAMSEGALWSTTTSRSNGVTRNPLDPSRTPGGSSGGSAAAVAAGYVAGALGTDMGGSVRIPAACCGLVGLKSQQGRFPARGRGDRAWHGLLCVGPLTADVADCALLLDVLCGPPQPALGRGLYSQAASAPPGRLRVGWSAQAPLGLPSHPVALSAAEAGVRLLESCGHDVVKVRPDYRLASITALPRYVHGAVTAADRLTGDVEARTRDVGLARALSSSYAARASRALQPLLSLPLLRLFDDVDVLMLPTLNGPVPLAESWSNLAGPHAAAAQAVFGAHTPMWNVTGQPVLTLPCGPGPGIPMSVQLVGRPWAEAQLLSLGGQLEQARDSSRP